MARLAELNDFTEFAKVAPMTADPDPRVDTMRAPMFQPNRKVEQPQSRVQWESRMPKWK